MLPVSGQALLSPPNDLINPSQCGGFGYFFPDADPVTYTDTTLGALAQLHDIMSAPNTAAANQTSALAPIITYFSQFLDHDITSMIVLDDHVVDIHGPDISPQPRGEVEASLVNARTGWMDLDSLYGGDGNAAHMDHFLRRPDDRAKMWVAHFAPETSEGGVTYPEDGRGDLLRLARLMTPKGIESHAYLTPAQIKAFPAPLRALYWSDDADAPRLGRAVIGDPRNDENLFVAQLHLAFLRLHNAIVDAYPHARRAGDADTVFQWAKTQVRLSYQWLVLHDYLPQICDPVALAEVCSGNAALYRDFLEAYEVEAHHHRPLPLEFSIAGFRLGYTMLRPSYDWNRFFGATDAHRNESSAGTHASLAQMFTFTGPGGMEGGTRLPATLGADWARLVFRPTENSNRSARKIDTHLGMVDAPSKDAETSPPCPNLRRGMRMTLPSAQACIEALSSKFGYTVTPLTQDELRSGHTRAAVEAGGFEKATPLWFYLLKEAEIKGGGNRLGPLGTHIVAGTLVGLLVSDPRSAWNTPGSVDGRWNPVDGVQPGGQLLDSFAGLMRGAGLMASTKEGPA